ncbi:MAG TPA: FlgD immunoglobulin-like domain containing protein [Solirubrobacteraceae bacterium]|nr:FlgD immunoglobulin-like domain containing protein [Solirubrobacteraceae bacterium]
MVFGLLVLATFAAFFVTQRLKHSPPLVQAVTAVPYISGAVHHTSAAITFKIKQADRVSVAVLAPDGRVVDTLVSDRRMPAYQQQGFRWYGDTASGAPAPDGLYTVRVQLRAQDRSVLLTRPSGELVTIRVERSTKAPRG